MSQYQISLFLETADLEAMRQQQRGAWTYSLRLPESRRATQKSEQLGNLPESTVLGAGDKSPAPTNSHRPTLQVSDLKTTTFKLAKWFQAGSSPCSVWQSKLLRTSISIHASDNSYFPRKVSLKCH